MAVRIQQYQQRTSPDSLGVVPTARGVHVDSSVAQATSRLGGAMMDAAGTYMQVQDRIKAEQKRQEEEDAKVYAANSIAQGTQAALQEFARRQDSAEPGAPGFAQGLNDWFDEYEETAVSQAPNDTSKKFIRERFLALRTDMGVRAISFETDERRKWRVDTGKAAIDATAHVVAQDASRFNVMRAEQHAMIEAYDIPQEQKRALREYTDDTMATAVVLGEAERDPEMVLAKIADRLGVEQSEVVGPGKQPSRAAHEVQAKYDSIGGSFGFRTTSTTRTKAENAAVDGVPNSQHLTGTARDWSIQGKSKGEVDGFVAALQAEGFEAFVHKTKNGALHVHSELPPERARRTVQQAATEKPEGETVGETAYDMLPVPKLVSLLGTVNSKLDQQQSKYRSLVAAREADDLAAYGDGKAPPQPLTAGEFIKAYGGVEGARRWQAYQGAQRFASDVSGFKTMPPEQIVATIKAREPQPGDGYASAAQQHNAAIQAARAVLTQRADDPIDFAMNNGLGEAAPINFQDPQAMGAELGRRVGVAETMSSKYGTRYTMLTKQEAGQMTAMLGGMTAPEKAQFLQTVRSSVPDGRAYQSIMGQLRPDSPVTALAGSIMTQQNPIVVKGAGWASRAEVIRPDRVAMTILAGEDILNPSKGDAASDGKGKAATFPMPSDAELRDTWVGIVGDAYRGSPETEAATFQAYRAFYAAAAQQAGKNDGEFDARTAEMAARSVTGGVVDVNGRNVVAPWGMPEDAFIDALRVSYEQAARAAGVAVDFDSVEFRTSANGVYLPSLGTEPLPFQVRVGESVSRSGTIGGGQ